MVSHGMRHFLQLFAEKLMKTPKHDSLLKKLQVFGQVNDIDIHRASFGKDGQQSSKLSTINISLLMLLYGTKFNVTGLLIDIFFVGNFTVMCQNNK